MYDGHFAAPWGSWRPSFGALIDADESGWNGYTLRVIITNNYIMLDGNLVRLRLNGPSSGQSVIGAMYFGTRSGTYAFNGDQVPVTVGGSGSFNLGAGVTYSDPFAFALDEGNDIVLAMQMTGTSSLRYKSGYDIASYYKSGTDASTTAATGYSSNSSSTLYTFDLIEVFP